MQTRRLRYSLGKRRQKGGVDFEKGDWGNCYTPVLGVEEKCHAEPVCFLVVFCWVFLVGLFVFFFWDKKEELLKVLWTCTFIRWLLNSFCFAQLQFRVDEKMLRLLMSLEAEGEDFWRLFYPCGVNELHSERVCPGDWWCGETIDFIDFQMKVFTDLGPWKKSLFVFLG